MYLASPGRSHNPCRGSPGRKLTKACSARFICLLGDSSTMNLGCDRRHRIPGSPDEEMLWPLPRDFLGKQPNASARRRGVRHVDEITSKTPRREPARAYPRPLLTA
jgi:hypothetical protein